uniref:Mitochondrial carrier protein n=1 Tax=Spumella elongata TaxID=89044 RepID=A0A7S3HQJ3_9STRA|eukprot:CAMPEP_0184983258 /NCGR_PEP_ID=MMETSP1098-20130426/12540_1 /TAXON_ID=89044 /ORGANISM="Spumella elongata, Strain CCAP 955/1" /LENGTH=299 /DNA_ID=CAMNT_0027507067 /DNA_START=31 /DNA_END=930 /DNA_ORIENTATION=-
MSDAAKTEKPKLDTWAILQKAAKRAGQGGLAGAAAMTINVCSLMWMRTTINYQYRYGTTTTQAFKTLYADGGIPRFYRGLVPALLQGPLSRFGDTAANTGTLAALDAFETTAELPVAAKTVAASVAAALFRILLMPIDTVKTTMQVEGKDGMKKLMTKFRAVGPSTFFQGAIAASAATFVGHYPWFFVYNYLNEVLPRYDETPKKLARSAVIGFCASAVSDTCSNSIRVIKVYKQSNTEKISYSEALGRVIKEDGLGGLFGRGLKTKILANGMQGLMFSVLWKLIDEKFFKKDDDQKRR